MRGDSANVTKVTIRFIRRTACLSVSARNRQREPSTVGCAVFTATRWSDAGER